MNTQVSEPSDRPERGRALVDQFLPVEYIEQREPAAPAFDKAAFLGVIYRQRWLISAAIALSLLAGLIVTILAVPVYQARTTLEVNPYSNYIVQGQDISQSVPTNQIAAFMETQGQIIESRKIALEVAESLDLANRTNGTGGELAGSPLSETQDPMALERAAQAVQAGVEAEVNFNTQVVAITYRHTDPVFAAEVANAYADAYVESETRRNIESNSYAREYLQEQISDVRQRLREAELASNNYAKENGIISQQVVSGGSSDDSENVTITGANLASINQTVTEARAARIAAEQKWRAVTNTPSSQLPEVQNSPVIATLQAERAKLVGELTNLRQRYNDNFPSIVDVRSRIDAIDDQIGAIGSEIKAGIRNEFLVAQRQEQALAGELNNVSQQTLSEQDRRVQYAVLEREATALRSQLDSLLARFNDISTAANVKSGRISKLDSALVPGSPVSPSLSRNIMLALLTGIGLAAGLAVLREMFDDKLRTLDQVENRLGLPLLGHTPFVDTSDIGNDEVDTFGNLMESYASIRATIDYSIPRDGYILQATSSHAGEGKSTTALIVAELFARMGRKTLLIDADLRSPSIASLIGEDPNSAGLSEILLGHTTKDAATITGTSQNLDIVCSGQIPVNPIELISSSDFADLLKSLREEYPLVIVDCPPVMGIADAPQIARQVDGTIFVAEANSARIGQAKSAIQRLNMVGARILGTIVTKYRPRTAGDSYGYGYSYYEYGRGRA